MHMDPTGIEPLRQEKQRARPHPSSEVVFLPSSAHAAPGEVIAGDMVEEVR